LYAVHPTFASSCWGKEREGRRREDRGETDQKEDRKIRSKLRYVNSQKRKYGISSNEMVRKEI
jgi:hypothetical protein